MTGVRLEPAGNEGPRSGLDTLESHPRRTPPPAGENKTVSVRSADRPHWPGTSSPVQQLPALPETSRRRCASKRLNRFLLDTRRLPRRVGLKRRTYSVSRPTSRSSMAISFAGCRHASLFKISLWLDAAINSNRLANVGESDCFGKLLQVVGTNHSREKSSRTEDSCLVSIGTSFVDRFSIDSSRASNETQ